MKSDIQRMKVALRGAGFKVKRLRERTWRNLKPPYRTWTIQKKGIRGAFCEPNGGWSYSSLDGQIAADNSKCFDKWRKCPLILPIPTNDKEIQFLIKSLLWLKSSEGFEASDNVKFDRYITEYK